MYQAAACGALNPEILGRLEEPDGNVEGGGDAGVGVEGGVSLFPMLDRPVVMPLSEGGVGGIDEYASAAVPPPPFDEPIAVGADTPSGPCGEGGGIGGGCSPPTDREASPPSPTPRRDVAA
jgi:hypothetical protein